MKWIWPLSWYFRIRELEREVALLRAVALELQGKLTAAYIEQSCLASTYSSAMASMASIYEACLGDRVR
jgi:hypothetical protein